MKPLQLLIFALAVTSLFTFNQCKKNKNEEPQLPPATTTGAMTFGCKVNGKVFVPRDGRGRPGLFVQYVNLGTGPGGGWYLNIPAIDWVSSQMPTMKIGTDSLLISENSTYEFDLAPDRQTIKGTAYIFYNDGLDGYKKLSTDTGMLSISKFDPLNKIIAGTFFFIGTSSTGRQVNVTEGRFDIRY